VYSRWLGAYLTPGSLALSKCEVEASLLSMHPHLSYLSPGESWITSSCMSKSFFIAT
jgi:hypothetical protein